MTGRAAVVFVIGVVLLVGGLGCAIVLDGIGYWLAVGTAFLGGFGVGWGVELWLSS